MPTTTYLPSLADLFPLERLPSSLAFLEAPVSTIFDNIYYRDYWVSRSEAGDSARYRLIIVINKALGMPILGTGFVLRLNPNGPGGVPQTTEFEIEASWRWPVLALFNHLDLSQLPSGFDELGEYFKSLLGGSDTELLARILRRVIQSNSSPVPSIRILVRGLNEFYSLTGTPQEISYSYSPETTYTDVVSELIAAGITIAQVITDFAIATDYPGGSDTEEGILAMLRFPDAEDILMLVRDLNSHFSLSNTANEIIYTDSPETTLDEVAEALSLAGVGPIDLLFDYFIDASSTETIITSFLQFLAGENANLPGSFTELVTPEINAVLYDVNFAIEFPRTVVIPVDGMTSEPLPEPETSLLKFTVGNFYASSRDGFSFENVGSISFTKSQILNTGLIIEFSGIKLDLSRTTNIPEAIADGRPVDFVGVYVQKATIGLPKKWFKPSSTSTAQIVGTDIIIGTGGFSGKVGFDAGGLLNTKLGNFDASLDAFDLRFERNSIVESNISGSLTVPGFKDAKTGLAATIDITAHIAEDGDFSVTATEKNGILLRIPGVLDFNVYTLGFGREENRFFLTTSGTVTLTFTIPGLSFDRPIAVDLKKLTIWEDGKIEIQGGTIILPQALTLKIGPVKLSVTAISMGSYTRNSRPYKYFGFDGGVDVKPGGVDVRANGVKVYYSTDSGPLDVFLRVEGIAIDLIIPGGVKSADQATVLISGFLQVKEPDPSIAGSTSGTEYAGGVSFKMPKAGIGGTAAMRLNPSIPNFVIDAELSISVPIPLGNTDLGIYGFRGLIGMRYVADRAYTPLGLAPAADWYEYYKKKVPLLFKEGINIDKFAPRQGFAVGAGLTLGTATDSGTAFSAKLFLLLSLPDALLLQGQAAIMSTRVDLSPNDPPFTVFIAVTRQSVEAAFGVNYKLPDTGEILDLQALIEMGFYFNDSSAWYINVGRDLPVSKRVTARLFTLFNAWSYLMLSSSGIRAGAGVTWAFDKGFGPVHVEAHAYLDTQGHISFKPKQIGAAIMLGGSASVRVFKFKLGLSVAAVLAAEAPQPFIVTGSVAVHVDLPRPIRKLGGTFTLQFTWTFKPFDPSLDALPSPIFNDVDVSEAAKAVNLATRERFALNVPAGNTSIDSALPPPPGSGWSGSFDDFVIPLDSAVDIEFKKPIAPGPGVTNIGITGAGCVYTELVPPQRGKSPQVQHQYVVEEVKIRSWNPATSQWSDYDVYAALTPLQHASFVKPGDLIGLKQGWWQRDQPGKMNKLSLLSQTPLSHANDVAGPFVPENSGVTGETIFCPDTPIEEQCLVIDDFPDLKTLTAGQRYALKDVQVRVTGKDGQVAPFLNPFGLTNGVALKPDSQLEMVFPEATGSVSLRLGTLADNVAVLYQQRRQTGLNSSRQPVYSFVTVKQEVLNAVNLLRPVKYDAIGIPIHKLVVLAGRCACLDGVTAGFALAIAGAPAFAPAPIASAPIAVPPTAVQAQPPQADLVPPRQETPPCGNVAAYLLSVCAEAQGQLNALQHQYEQLVSQANEYEVLAQQFQGNPCDPTLPTRYHQMATALLAQAAALQAEIKSLVTLTDCCRKLRPTLVFATDRALVQAETQPVRGVSDCNIDPKFDYTCMSFVFGLCWLPLRDQMFNNTIPSFSTLLGNNTAMVTAINNTIYPVWRPETIYAVSIRTVDNVSVHEIGLTSATPKYMHIGFRTRGPVGDFAEHRAEYKALAAQDRADQYRLQSLKPYIDFSKSYPNADGNVLRAKPLFYVKPKLRLFYIHQYIYTMYGGQFDAYNGNPAVTSSIEVSILDPIDPLPAPADPGFVGPVSVVFASNTLGHSNPDVQLLHNMATQGAPCTGVGHNGIAPMGVQSNVTVDKLKPLKLYVAVFKANYTDVKEGDKEDDTEDDKEDGKEEVHRYNFQTSRYADFGEQVNSYQLKDPNGVFLKNAIFDDISVTLDATNTARLIALLGHTYPSGDPLEQEYADPFDRLVDGILRVGPMDPPTGTDFNIVRDGANNNVIGILVRNPEPFNDPKVPAADIDGTIVLSQLNAPPAVFTTLYSSDRSRAFIGNAALMLALHDLDFTFTYLEYSGSAYVPASVVKVSFFPSPPGPVRGQL